jgi:hypothetical protein
MPTEAGGHGTAPATRYQLSSSLNQQQRDRLSRRARMPENGNGRSMSTDSPLATPHRASWVRLLLLLVPAAYFAIVVAVRPADRLGPPQAAPWIDQLVFDDNDVAAYALRGLNASLGRHAGRDEAPERTFADRYAEALAENRSLAPRYYLEYPHAALLLFQVAYVFGPRLPVPAGLLDGAHEDLVCHTPDDAQAGLWQHFHRFATAFMLTMIAFHAGLVGVLAAGYQTGGRLAYRGLLLILPGVLFFSLNRFDIVPALLTALAFACLGRGRLKMSAVLLAAGTLIKVYPIFLAPLVLRYLQSTSPRMAARWALVYVIALLAFLAPATCVWGADEVAAPYLVQLSRRHEGLTAYCYLIPFDGLREELAGNGVVGRMFRLGTLATVLSLMVLRPISDLESVLRRGTVVLITFTALSVFYSPQWTLWLIPLLLPLAARQPRLVGLIVLLDLATWIQWPIACRLAQLLDLESFNRDVILTILAFARFAALALIIRDLIREDRMPYAAVEATPVLA